MTPCYPRDQRHKHHQHPTVKCWHIHSGAQRRRPRLGIEHHVINVENSIASLLGRKTTFRAHGKSSNGNGRNHLQPRESKLVSLGLNRTLCFKVVAERTISRAPAVDNAAIALLASASRSAVRSGSGAAGGRACGRARRYRCQLRRMRTNPSGRFGARCRFCGPMSGALFRTQRGTHWVHFSYEYASVAEADDEDAVLVSWLVHEVGSA